MSEEKNIQEGQEAGKPQSPEELISSETESFPKPEEVSADEERKTINYKQETAPMEVHHHTSHTHGKKNWKTYFWEFLMLFLAVFCGFLAEYQLEHKIEKDREKQFIVSLVDDLKSDVKGLERHMVEMQERIIIMDSLFLLMDNPEQVRKQGDLIYYYARLGPRTITFSGNNRTFDQLRNSGGFRLIRSQEASDKIMSYYVLYPHLRQLEDIFSNEFEDYKRVASKIFDPTVFRNAEGKNGEIVLTKNSPSLRSYDPNLLKEMEMSIIYLNGTRKAIYPTIQNLKKTAAELIRYLEEKYKIR